MTNAKVYFALELNLNSEEKGGWGEELENEKGGGKGVGEGTAVVVNKSVKLGWWWWALHGFTVLGVPPSPGGSAQMRGKEKGGE